MSNTDKDLSQQLVNQNVAVYGTLRDGQGNHHILYGLPYDNDVVRGYKMYSLGGFPYVVHTGDDEDQVQVEVYKVPDESTAYRLDGLEGYCPERGYTNFYDRTIVTTEQGRTVNMYFFHEADESDPVVPLGDWANYRPL